MKTILLNSIIATVVFLLFTCIAAPERLHGAFSIGGCISNTCVEEEPCSNADPDCIATDGGHCKSWDGYDSKCNKPSPCGEGDDYPEECHYPRFCTATGDPCPEES